MKNSIDLKDFEKNLYNQIREHHFDKFGYFDNSFASWDYFERVNDAGRKILKLVKQKRK